jgi:uncharacterized membrane protein YidH (DUF202 family)
VSQKPRLAPELDKPGLQPERNALAWERTAISMLLLGVLLARAGSKGGHWEIALAGLAQTVVGSAVLIWAGFNYRRLHGPIEHGGDGVVHPGAARTVGWITIVFTAVSLAVAIDMILT